MGLTNVYGGVYAAVKHSSDGWWSCAFIILETLISVVNNF